MAQAAPATIRRSDDPDRSPDAEGWWGRQQLLPRTVYWGIHAACLLGVLVHAHARRPRSCSPRRSSCACSRSPAATTATSRTRPTRPAAPFQFVLAVLGASATQKGAALVGRPPPRPPQVRRPARAGRALAARRLLVLAPGLDLRHGRWDATSLDQIRDFARYPGARVAEPLARRAADRAGGGSASRSAASAACSGASRSRPSLLWHATYSINSLAHRWGTRRYDTPDTSRNNLAAGAAHARRGLAQQPPSLLCVGAPGLLLVGDRRHATTCCARSRPSA